MCKLRKSSTFNLYYRDTENFDEYIRRGLEFYKTAGFDAADFGMGMLNLSEDGWQSDIDNVLRASEDTGVKFEICHLPFVGGGGTKSAEFMEVEALNLRADGMFFR